ncbi:DUF4268 domain-containing protein [Limnohabitans sp. Jir72]|uniref:DUF4268 domain-containing protein n=1 Tax=Limnohabitans sp. Jir72 TaxID=1977909 RepID=UPI000D3C7831|nr:DUF4268 domain-containing protein [Limnohabitans sp. Jir72]PUE31411.1 hypothetical protein B9Z52_10965 [Limnohabitans sp. Jir72]
MKKTLSKLERVPLREAWKHEANDFTPWLAEEDNLNTLADALGLADLELVATEHWVGEFKLDILCTSGDDQVIIENQLEKTNHTHLGQILTYAAGTGAKKVIWVAESFRPEHVAAFEFLNQNTTEELSFFAVEVVLWRIGDSPLAPKFEVVAKPNDWAKTGREQTKAAANATPTKQLQLKLWHALVDVLAQKAPNIRPQTPRPQHWLNIAIGRAGFKIAPTASHKDDRLGVEVYIFHNESKKMYEALLSQKPSIEQALGFELDWQELPDAHACRIATWRQDSPIEDEAQWGAYLDWFVQRIVKMNAVFRPVIQAIG